MILTWMYKITVSIVFLIFQAATSLIQLQRGTWSIVCPISSPGPASASKVVTGGDHCQCVATMETEVRSPHSIHCVAAAPSLSTISNYLHYQLSTLSTADGRTLTLTMLLLCLMAALAGVSALPLLVPRDVQVTANIRNSSSSSLYHFIRGKESPFV